MTLTPAQRQSLSWLLIAAAALVAVWALAPVLMPFLLGAGLAYALPGAGIKAVIFAQLAGGHLFGFVGVLVALRLSALVRVAGRRVTGACLGSALCRQ